MLILNPRLRVEGHHEIVHSLIEIVCRCHGFGVERRFTIHHPQVAANERYGDRTYVVQPFAGNRVPQRKFLEPDVGCRVGVILGYSALRRYGRIPGFRVYQAAAVYQSTPASRAAAVASDTPNRSMLACVSELTMPPMRAVTRNPRFRFFHDTLLRHARL